MIDIRAIYRSANGSQVKETVTLAEDELDIPQLKKLEDVELSLLRVEEGLMLLIDKIHASLELYCVRCMKSLVLPVEITEGEWLYYDRPPKDYDDENEFLFIDKERFEIDPREPVRQEILLHVPEAPHCEKDCVHFEEGQSGVKALSQLKDLWNSQSDES